MMAFCEDCGAPLTPGVMFCENCGAKVTSDDDKISENECVESGIIFTNLKKLSVQTGNSGEKILSVLNGFIADAAARGVAYEIFDVDEKVSADTVNAHVELVKKLVQEKHPDYLFIVGSNTVIPSIVWKNKASDSGSDADVSSDLPYTTLDVTSPFEGQQYDFSETLKTGRLPNVDFEKYFENLKTGCGKCGTLKTYCESAAVWINETVDIYRNIEKEEPVLSSPGYTRETISDDIFIDTNLLLFNLHGSNNTEFWYGQRGSSYPEAVDPDSFKNIDVPYFLAVEACYGAAYEGRSAEKSILLSALNGKCISFLGSSRIAFGTSEPKGCCADVICDYQLRNLSNNHSAGESLNLARTELMKKKDDAEVVKTLAEFSLYGDPSARMNGQPEAPKGLFARTQAKCFAKGIHIPLPDVRHAVRMELTTVDGKIAETVEKTVQAKYADLIGIKPVYYKTASSGSDYKAVYNVNNQIGSKIVAVDFLKNGQVKAIKESK